MNFHIKGTECADGAAPVFVPHQGYLQKLSHTRGLYKLRPSANSRIFFRMGIYQKSPFALSGAQGSVELLLIRTHSPYAFCVPRFRTNSTTLIGPIADKSERS